MDAFQNNRLSVHGRIIMLRLCHTQLVSPTRCRDLLDRLIRDESPLSKGQTDMGAQRTLKREEGFVPDVCIEALGRPPRRVPFLMKRHPPYFTTPTGFFGSDE